MVPRSSADVIVGAEAEHIVGGVGAVVRTTHRSQMRALGVRASSSFEPQPANLTPEVIEGFDPLRHGGVADEALHTRVRLLLVRSRLRRWIGDRVSGWFLD
jgi:hypothetical protein